MKKITQVHADEVFREEIKKLSDFKFNKNVANVFDDMVDRSVPFYQEIQRMIVELVRENVIADTNVIDLGCSTGTTFLGLDPHIDESIGFIGVDSSDEMLKKCRSKLKEANLKRHYEILQGDILNEPELKNASVVILSLTLQFIRPIYREKLIQRAYDSLVQNGVLIVVEKILAEEASFNRSFIEFYYDYKRRNNYSELEISQKREALENVLIPYKLSENLLLLRDVGFSHVETFFKWYNFAGFIAVKN